MNLLKFNLLNLIVNQEFVLSSITLNDLLGNLKWICSKIESTYFAYLSTRSSNFSLHLSASSDTFRIFFIASTSFVR